jgi:IS30 family transposase
MSGRLRFEMGWPERVELLWKCRSMGATYGAVADEVGITQRTVGRVVRDRGGMAPRPWKNPDRLLTFDERWRIKELTTEGLSIRAIGRALGRAPSTVLREMRRGADTDAAGRYRPTKGQRVAFTNRRRPQALKITTHPELAALVQQGLDAKHSPQQICHRLRKDHPDREDLHVSAETIYKTIYLQARGGLKREVQALTRTGRTIRYPRRAGDERRSRIKDAISIWDRPVEALDRTIPGHWEGDLIVGKDGKSAIATIVERRSNYLILVWLDPTKDRVTATRDGLIDKLAGLPEVLKGSLTWDRGTEMHAHAAVTRMTGIDIFFADPHAPWQRATNENTNGLLRQYFPKGTDLSGFTQLDLDYVADEMNGRPRRILDWATPYETIREHLLQ